MQPTLTDGDISAAAPTPRRRFRRRLAIGGVLVLVAVVGVWLLPWILMSDDLRRVQGEWIVDRIESGLQGEIDLQAATETTARIACNRLEVSYVRDEYALIDLESDGRLRLSLFEDQKESFFGFNLTLPRWLGSPVDRYVGDYTLTESDLVLVLRGKKMRDGEYTPLEDGWRKLYLKRR